jgi:hypothetical protein
MTDRPSSVVAFITEVTAQTAPWPHRPCRNCYARGMAAPFAERLLVVYADCPLCLGSGVEPPGTDSTTTERGEA